MSTSSARRGHESPCQAPGGGFVLGPGCALPTPTSTPWSRAAIQVLARMSPGDVSPPGRPVVRRPGLLRQVVVLVDVDLAIWRHMLDTEVAVAVLVRVVAHML